MAARTGDDIWGQRTPYSAGESWPVRVDQHLIDGVTVDDVDSWVPSACLLCSNGCGLDIAVKDGQMVGVRGRAEDRVNHGRLDPKDRDPAAAAPATSATEAATAIRSPTRGMGAGRAGTNGVVAAMVERARDKARARTTSGTRRMIRPSSMRASTCGSQE